MREVQWKSNTRALVDRMAVLRQKCVVRSGSNEWFSEWWWHWRRWQAPRTPFNGNLLALLLFDLFNLSILPLNPSPNLCFRVPPPPRSKRTTSIRANASGNTVKFWTKPAATPYSASALVISSLQKFWYCPIVTFVGAALRWGRTSLTHPNHCIP